MTIEERAENAVLFKKDGKGNCCQAVTAALADLTELSEEQLHQIAAGFGGGMGTMEATCGALVGAGIVAGLATRGESTKTYTRQMLRAFSMIISLVTFMVAFTTVPKGR